MCTRRSLLFSAATLASATLAGCATVLGGETDRHYVDMLNADEEPHVFAVTVTDEAGETVFEHTYDLRARHADENRIIEGSPEAVTVVINDDDRVQFPWAPREGVGGIAEECSRSTSASLSIWYEQRSGDGVKPTYGCETVRDQ